MPWSWIPQKVTQSTFSQSQENLFYGAYFSTYRVHFWDIFSLVPPPCYLLKPHDLFGPFYFSGPNWLGLPVPILKFWPLLPTPRWSWGLACPYCAFLWESFKPFSLLRVDYLQNKLSSLQFWSVTTIIKSPSLYFTRDCPNPMGYWGWDRLKVGKERKKKSCHIANRGMLTSRWISPG